VRRGGSSGIGSAGYEAGQLPRAKRLIGLLKNCLVWRTYLDKMSGIADTTEMAQPALPLPSVQALRKLGRDLALARRKRGISTADMSGRLFVSRDTLWRLERGDPTVSVGTLATAAFVLQLHDRLANLAAPSSDALALALDERRLPKHIHRSKT
jgi:DNA-binding XRE family transcriptional regulator